MKKLFWIVNLPRTLLIYLLTKNSRQRALIFKDLERFAYGERKNKGPYRTFSEVNQSDDAEGFLPNQKRYGNW